MAGGIYSIFYVIGGVATAFLLLFLVAKGLTYIFRSLKK